MGRIGDLSGEGGLWTRPSVPTDCRKKPGETSTRRERSLLFLLPRRFMMLHSHFVSGFRPTAMRPLVIAGGIAILLLSGCASSGSVSELNTRLDSIDQRLDSMNQQLDAAEARSIEAEETAEAAARRAEAAETNVRAAAARADAAAQKAAAAFDKTVRK